MHGIDLDIADREFIALVGPSGCGKSTTLRMIAGLEEITAGAIEIGGAIVNDLPPRARNISMVFQSYALYPHMTRAREHGLLAEDRRRRQGGDRRAASPRRRPSSASTRCSTAARRSCPAASASASPWAAPSCASPTSSCSTSRCPTSTPSCATQMRTEIKKLHAKVQSTVIYVTHDQVEAMTLADRIVIMRDGYIEQVGTPDEVFRRPATRFVAGFIGSPPMNLHEATIDDGQHGFRQRRKAAAARPVQGQCRDRRQGRVRAAAGRHLSDRPWHQFRRRQPTSIRSSCRSRSPSRSATRRWSSSNSTARLGVAHAEPEAAEAGRADRR